MEAARNLSKGPPSNSTLQPTFVSSLRSSPAAAELYLWLGKEIRSRIISGLILGLVVIPAGSESASPRFTVVLSKSDSTGCMEVDGPPLGEGDTLLVVSTNPVIVTTAVVNGETTGPCVDGRGVLGDSLAYHQILYRPLGGPGWFIGIGVFADGSVARVVDGQPEVRLGGENIPYTFGTCASSEGVHLIVQQGGRRIWHRYYYMGFDLESDCTGQDFEEP